MKVLILHSLAPQTPADGRISDEFDLGMAVDGIAEVLPDAEIAGVNGELREILALLDRHQPDVVLNACEAPLGRPDLEPHVPALLEWLNIRFTGCGSETLALCRHKDRVNGLLAAAGIPIPPASGFPCIVKPADEDGSAHIHQDNICQSEADIARIRLRIPGPVIVQRFLRGREFVVSLWGETRPEFSSIGETVFQNGLQLITYSAKWRMGSVDYDNSPLDYETLIDPPLRKLILDLACAAWEVVGARQYLRMDFRLDAEGRPHILDVNPNAELGPYSGICRAVEEAGWTCERFFNQLLEWA